MNTSLLFQESYNLEEINWGIGGGGKVSLAAIALFYSQPILHLVSVESWLI
jgi:hypothetical protein